MSVDLTDGQLHVIVIGGGFAGVGCVRHSVSSTESAGSVPKRQVPAWCAQPATGMSFLR